MTRCTSSWKIRLITFSFFLSIYFSFTITFGFSFRFCFSFILYFIHIHFLYFSFNKISLFFSISSCFHLHFMLLSKQYTFDRLLHSGRLDSLLLIMMMLMMRGKMKTSERIFPMPSILEVKHIHT